MRLIECEDLITIHLDEDQAKEAQETKVDKNEGEEQVLRSGQRFRRE